MNKENVAKLVNHCHSKKEFSSGGSRNKQYEVIQYVMKNYPDRAKTEVFEPQPITQRVTMPDGAEFMVWYDYKNEKVTSMAIPKTPILKCRECGFIFDHGSKECRCPGEEKLYVDIDAMNHYYRVNYTGDNIQKLEVIRDIERRDKE